jgi:hypothetical protein
VRNLALGFEVEVITKPASGNMWTRRLSEATPCVIIAENAAFSVQMYSDDA